MINNIVNLTKILSKDLLSKFDFINLDNKKINKKNTIFWLLLTIIITLCFLSYKIIYYLRDINQHTVFLSVYWMISSIIILFQVTLISINNYYFSNELKVLLPLPIKPKELLIAKFLTIVFTMYISEAIFLIFPMIIYGVMTYCNLWYYIYLTGVLIIFPIMPVLIVSILMAIFMKFSKFVKNKNIFQIFVIFISIIGVFFIQYKIITGILIETNGQIDNEKIVDYILNFNDKIKSGNKYLIQVNDIIGVLTNQNLKEILGILKIVFIDLLLFMIFIFGEGLFYIKDILKNNTFNISKKLIKFANIKITKRKNKKIAYLNKELKLLFRNSTFFVQGVFPSLVLMFTIILFTVKFVPSIREFLKWEAIEGRINLNYNLKMAGAILFLIQIVFAMSNISITGISREGKNAKVIKELPMKLYDQFICKSFVQVLINNTFIIVFIVFLHRILPQIQLFDLCFLLIIILLMNIINSRLMLFIDLINPNVNWDSEFEMNKNSKNKIFQYAFSIIMILFITYLVKLLDNTSIIMSYLIFIDIFMMILFIINFIVKLNIKQLFNKIDH